MSDGWGILCTGLYIPFGDSIRDVCRGALSVFGLTHGGNVMLIYIWVTCMVAR